MELFLFIFKSRGVFNFLNASTYENNLCNSNIHMSFAYCFSSSEMDYMKEELVSRLLKEKEELLKLRRKKETERERIIELR